MAPDTASVCLPVLAALEQAAPFADLVVSGKAQGQAEQRLASLLTVLFWSLYHQAEQGGDEHT